MNGKRKNKRYETEGVGLIGLIKAWVQSFRSVDGVELPREGRSSVESGSGLLGGIGALAFGSVQFPFNPDYLRLLKDLWLYNPDLSQMVTNVQNLGNTGHQITVDAATDAKAEAAMQRLNESAARIYANGAGVDGLINAYLAQIAWSGALSSEDVVNFAAGRVEQVVIVPVEQIRFRLIDGQYVPHQQPGSLFGLQHSPMGLIPLNPETYRYYALQTVQNLPYAKPPALAAVDILMGPQKDAIENIKFIVQKLGILGMVAVNLTKPNKKPGETDSEFNSRAQKYLRAVREVLDGNFRNGLLVMFNDQKIQHANIVSDARGSEQIFQVIEEQAFSGMGSMAAFHGRNYSTTETFAAVIYHFMTAQAGNMARLAKRRQEQTYRLDLRLGGIEVDGLSLNFDKALDLNPLESAQADQARFETAKAKAEIGMISPDEAAQECGYDSAFDPELMSSQPEVATALRAKLGASSLTSVTATFRFDRAAQRYRFLPSRIQIASDPVEADSDSNIFLLKKKAA